MKLKLIFILSILLLSSCKKDQSISPTNAQVDESYKVYSGGYTHDDIYLVDTLTITDEFMFISSNDAITINVIF